MQEKPPETKLNDVKKTKIVMEAPNVSLLAFNSPLKAFPKALNKETSKADSKQAALVTKQDESKQTNEIKNNNKAASSKANIDLVNESDDDDSVFINENKPKKASANKTMAKNVCDTMSSVQPASCNASSVMLSGGNVSSSNIKPVAPVAAQNHNSRDLNVKSETVVR